MSEQQTTRRHDLDALRGFAMVLGIALHASLAFFPTFWPAQDATSGFAGPYDEFFHAVHGFRMPLFFMLSGFFTTMLWRRRSLASLLRHRIRRIAIPLALAVLTIVPAVNWSVSWAFGNGIADYVEESGDIWAAAFFGNAGAVEALLDGGVDVDAPNVADKGDTPLHVAAAVNDLEIVDLLLDRGANPNARSTDGTPMDYALFFGSEAVAERLVDAGASDPRAPGTDWADISFWAVGAGTLDQAEELGLDTWLASFHHLWFLWFLLWLVAGFAVIALVADRFASSNGEPVAWTGPLLWALIPLTLVPQMAMGEGGALPVFGPDTSTGLLPVPHVLAYYAVFFAFGALLYGRRNRKDEFVVDVLGRWWKILLPVTIVVVFPIALDLTFGTDEPSWGLASIAQVSYTWAMIAGLMGLFGAVLAKERRGVRYLSDSSYWLYLAHVPLVIVAQSWIRNWDLPSGVKFVALTAGASLLLLVTYQLFVRYTPIGTLLNGKRTRPGNPVEEKASATA